MTEKITRKITCDYCFEKITDKWWRIDYEKVISSGAPNIYRDSEVKKDYHIRCYDIRNDLKNLNSRIPKK